LQILGGDPDRAAQDVAKLHDLISDDTRHVHRNGESHTGIVVSAANKSGANADEVALKIDEGPTRTARVDGSIGLDEVLVLLDSNIVPVQTSDDARGHRLAHAGGKADGKHKIANLKLPGIGERNGRQVFRLHLDDGDVEVGIGADVFCLQLAAIGESNGDLFGMLDNVTIGDDETLAGIIDDAGARAAYLTRLGLFG